ncbi:MAG: MFS transporter [Pseudonocardia sp.]|nr:MFS transporter [Pseudonocardia sp.]
MTTSARAGVGDGPTTVPIAVVVVAFLAVLLDGFDAATLAFVVPTLARDWAITPAGFTLPLVLTNVGVVLGYLACGTLGARFGRRRLLVGGLVVFAACTLVVAITLPAQSVPLLTVLRFLTGLGLGSVLPVAVSLATTHSPTRRRELVSVIVTLGLASGATLGGFFGGRLLAGVGADGVFWVAGLLPLVVAGAAARLLPSESGLSQDTAQARHDARVGRLFDARLRTDTVLLWAFSFLVFVAAYTLTSWVPTLLLGYGFAPADAPLGLAFVSLGGVLGGIVLIPLAARIGITRALIIMAVVGAACMAIAARVDLGHTGLLLVLGGAGLGVTAGQIGQLALAVTLYPESTRTTGVGWAAALGRAGSVIGPGLAGILLALALPGADIILMTAAPVLIAGLCATALWRRTT